MVDLKVLEEKTPILKEIRSEKEVFWQNPDKSACGEAMFPGNKGEKRNH